MFIKISVIVLAIFVIVAAVHTVLPVGLKTFVLNFSLGWMIGDIVFKVLD